ncbi:MAG: hypothetical protein ACUVRD_08070 [Bacteroidia bacterium]
MKWSVVYIGVCFLWGQRGILGDEVLCRARTQARDHFDAHLLLLSGKDTLRFPLAFKNARAEVRLPTGVYTVVLQVEHHLPLIYKGPMRLPVKEIDFTRAEHLIPPFGKDTAGRAFAYAGDWGSLPDESKRVINAYDVELFLQRLAVQDPGLDFNGDGVVDKKDYDIVLENAQFQPSL